MVIYNAVHDTTARVYPRQDGTISASTRTRALRALCGLTDCKCLGSGASSQESRELLAATPNEDGRYQISVPVGTCPRA